MLFSLRIFFGLKSSETYAKKILWSAFFEGGSADRYLEQGPDIIEFFRLSKFNSFWGFDKNVLLLRFC